MIFHFRYSKTSIAVVRIHIGKPIILHGAMGKKQIVKEVTRISNERVIPRMRTLPKAFEEIKAMDSETAISMRGLRQMCASGEVKTYQIGRKTLVNLDSLIDMLSVFDEAIRM